MGEKAMHPICEEADCRRQVKSRGLCVKHYQRARRAGTIRRESGATCIDCDSGFEVEGRGPIPVRCAPCRKVYAVQCTRKWQEENPDKDRLNRQRYYASVKHTRTYTPDDALAAWVRRLKKHYDLSVDQYRQMLGRQNGTCAICHGPPKGKGADKGRYHVDHCHKTGKVRGLLCSSCNLAIGYLGDDAQRVRRAAQYIEDAL